MNAISASWEGHKNIFSALLEKKSFFDENLPAEDGIIDHFDDKFF